MKCEYCGVDTSTYFRFYYGTHINTSGFVGRPVTRITRIYLIAGSECVFICNQCTAESMEKGYKQIVSFLWPVVFLLLPIGLYLLIDTRLLSAGKGIGLENAVTLIICLIWSLMAFLLVVYIVRLLRNKPQAIKWGDDLNLSDTQGGELLAIGRKKEELDKSGYDSFLTRLHYHGFRSKLPRDWQIRSEAYPVIKTVVTLD